MADETNETVPPTAGNWLTGQFLVAMPGLHDPRFEKTVMLVCSHGPDGAMALVLNRMFGELRFSGLIEQFSLQMVSPDVPDRPVFYGGPVDPVRGFVIHSSEYKREGTNVITSGISLTATIEVLRDMAMGEGPQRSLVTLGYAGWAPGQLEMELQANGWLIAPLDEAIIFDDNLDTKWLRALANIGVSPSSLVSDIGHA